MKPMRVSRTELLFLDELVTENANFLAVKYFSISFETLIQNDE